MARLKYIIIALLLAVALTHQPALRADESTSSTNERQAVAFVVTQFHELIGSADRNKTLTDCVLLMDRLRPMAVTNQEKSILKSNGFGFNLVNDKTEIKDPQVLSDLYRRTKDALTFHHRDGIVEYVVFKHDSPILITKAGAFIAISTRALRIAKNDDALAGIIAHELSHEYVAMQSLEAHKSNNLEKLRQIELLCDVFATVTLIKLNRDPDKYAQALSDIVHNSKASEELNNGTNGMPTLEARLEVIAQITKLLRPTQNAFNKR